MATYRPTRVWPRGGRGGGSGWRGGRRRRRACGWRRRAAAPPGRRLPATARRRITPAPSARRHSQATITRSRPGLCSPGEHIRPGPRQDGCAAVEFAQIWHQPRLHAPVMCRGGLPYEQIRPWSAFMTGRMVACAHPGSSNCLEPRSVARSAAPPPPAARALRPGRSRRPGSRPGRGPGCRAWQGRARRASSRSSRRRRASRRSRRWRGRGPRA